MGAMGAAAGGAAGESGASGEPGCGSGMVPGPNTSLMMCLSIARRSRTPSWASSCKTGRFGARNRGGGGMRGGKWKGKRGARWAGDGGGGAGAAGGAGWAGGGGRWAGTTGAWDWQLEQQQSFVEQSLTLFGSWAGSTITALLHWQGSSAGGWGGAGSSMMQHWRGL